MCNLINYVVAHEVGHTLGFQHNMKASSDLHDRADSRSEVGEGERPHADADGLLALQLRRAAGRQDRRRAISSRRSGRTTSGRRTGATRRFPARRRRKKRSRRSTSGRASRTTKPYLRFSTEGERRHGSGRRDRSGRRRRCVDGDDARHQEPVARVRDADEGDQLQDRRSVGRARRSLRPHGRPVDDRDGPRRRRSSAAWTRSRSTSARTAPRFVHGGEGAAGTRRCSSC